MGNTEKKVEKTREKSVKYPYYSLSDCLEFVSLINQIAGRGEASVGVVLKTMGVSGESNKQYSYKLSSCSQFGLIEKTSGGLKITDRARLILYPVEGDKQRAELVKEAFMSPPLYKKIIEKYDGIEIPEHFPNVLLDMGIASNVIDRAANVFLASANFAGIMEDNRLSINDSVKIDVGNLQSQTHTGSSENSVIARTDPTTYVVAITGPGLNLNIEVKNEEDLAQIETLKLLLKGKLKS